MLKINVKSQTHPHFFLAMPPDHDQSFIYITDLDDGFWGMNSNLFLFLALFNLRICKSSCGLGI